MNPEKNSKSSRPLFSYTSHEGTTLEARIEIVHQKRRWRIGELTPRFYARATYPSGNVINLGGKDIEANRVEDVICNLSNPIGKDHFPPPEDIKNKLRV